MSSKDWKCLLLASLALSFLSACSNGSNDKGSAAPPSPYSGLWANDQALGTYRQSHGNMDQFCNTVRANPSLFEQEFSLDVKGNGDVSRYIPGSQANQMNPYFAESLRLGTISENGDFSDPQTSAPTYSRGFSNGGRSNPGDPRASLQGGIFERFASDRLVWTDSRNYSRQKSFVRVSENEMRSFSVAVRTCMGLQRGNPSVQQYPNGQPQFPNQTQIPPGPPQQYQPLPPQQMFQGNFPPTQPRYYQNPGQGGNMPDQRQAAPPNDNEAPEIAPHY